jgi:hypothetical protein
MQSVLVGGPALKLYRRQLGGAAVRVAMIGGFDFADATFVDTAMKVIRGERAFWGGTEGAFLVAAAPLAAEPGHISVRGEGREGAFAI